MMVCPHPLVLGPTLGTITALETCWHAQRKLQALPVHPGPLCVPRVIITSDVA